jgi:hypothetical protein
MSAENCYTFVHRDSRLEPVSSLNDLINKGGVPPYLCGVLGTFHAKLPAAGLNIWITWIGNRIPSPRDTRTVLLMIGDECSQVPEYADRFLYCFRTGTQRIELANIFANGKPTWQRCLELARYGRNASRRLYRAVRYKVPFFVPRSVISIPLGVAHAFPVDEVTSSVPIPIRERQWDVAFVGSAGRYLSIPWKPASRIGCSPKACVRLDTLSGVKLFQKNHPEVRCMMRLFDIPDEGHKLEKAKYAQAIENTKISLCPGGNFAETFRLYEAASAGSVIISDNLGKEWYFHNHPFIEVTNWRQIGRLLSELLSDENHLERLGRQSRLWWDNIACAAAVGTFIAQVVSDRSLGAA